METLVLPFFTLQPLVENAIEHGLLNPGQLQGGNFLISCQKRHGICEIKIADDALFLSRNAKKVYGVEIVEDAILDAKKNASHNQIDNVEFICGKSEDVLPIIG